MGEMTLEQQRAVALARARLRLQEQEGRATTEIPPINVDPAAGMGVGEKIAAGAGKAVADIGLGLKQRLGLTSTEEVEDVRRRDAPLMATGSGKFGNVAGGIASFLPVAMIPGANTAIGSVLLGGGMGAATPTSEGESVGANVALGAGGGLLGKLGGDWLTKTVRGKIGTANVEGAAAASQNAPRDAVLQAARQEGLVVPPTIVNPTATNRVMESLGGKAATAQQASISNQTAFTNKLVRRALGLPDDAAITETALNGIRKTAGQAYEAIKQLPVRFKTDQTFDDAVGALGKEFSAAAREFPEIAGNEQVKALQTALSKSDIGPDAAIEVIKKLRFDSAKNFKAFDDPAKAALAKAQRGAAEALESLVERNLIKSGQGNLVAEFRNARQLIAKTHDVENALLEGGNVSAKQLAKALQAGRPLTGELQLIARAASSFERAMQNPAQAAGAGVSNLQGLTSIGLGTFGGVLTGGPGAVIGAAPFVVPPVARNAMLTDLYQSLFATPQYGPGKTLRALGTAIDNSLLTPTLTVSGAQTAKQ